MSPPEEPETETGKALTGRRGPVCGQRGTEGQPRGPRGAGGGGDSQTPGRTLGAESERWLRKPPAGAGGRWKTGGRKGTATTPVSCGGERSSRHAPRARRAPGGAPGAHGSYAHWAAGPSRGGVRDSPLPYLV